jgi:O-antigen/teichoic acid export membrane protein
MTFTSTFKHAKALLERGDFLPVLALVIAIQGTVLVSQSVAALFLAPAAIGRIRLFESVISVAVLFSGFGAAALAVRDVAVHRQSPDLSERIINFLILPIFGAFLISLFVIISKLFRISWTDQILDISLVTIFLILFINLVRLSSAVAQGLLIVRRIYFWVILGSLTASASQIFGAYIGTMESWVGGRILGETILLVVIWMAMRGDLPVISWRKIPRLQTLLTTAGRAALINTGLTLRMIADAAPILLLSGVFPAFAKGGNAAEIGHFGIATLFLTAALLGPAVVSQRTLPIIAAAAYDTVPAINRQFLKRMTVAGIVIAATVAVTALSLRHLDDGRLDEGLLAAAAIMLSVPMKAVATAFGTMMLAKGELRLPIYITLAELAVILLVFSCLGDTDAVWLAATSVIFGATMSMTGMAICNNFVTKK